MELENNWVDIKGFEGKYQINPFGWVKSVGRNISHGINGKLVMRPTKILKMTPDSMGYIRYGLCKDGKRFDIHAHRIVAEHFIENKDDKPEVNHIDGDKGNCHYTNLEWVTASENHLHAYRVGLQNCYQSLVVIDMNTGVFYNSIKEAAKIYKMSRMGLTNMLYGKYKNKTTLSLC